jgi:hypothetical protein
MSIVDIVRQGLEIARKHRSLWLFAFVVGLGVVGGGRGGPSAAGPHLQPGVILVGAAIALAGILVMKFVSEGALIEGVTRARRHESLSVREGFSVGWAHWGVLFRISALYVVASVGSGLVLGAPAVLALQLFGRAALALVAIPTVVVGIPWLVTLYVLQALASRIAVLENRYALDSLRKARLFLHGRMLHALKLMAAALVGTLLVSVAGLVVLAPLALLLVGASKLIGGAFTLAIGLSILVPAAFVLVAFIGTVQSAPWTLGYLEHAER